MIIALLHSLAMGYESHIGNILKYLILFFYTALFGMLCSLPLGALCGAFVGSFYKITGKNVTRSKLGSLSSSLFFGAIVLFLIYRIYSYEVPFSHYPFIKSYRGMLIFISLRMVIMTLAGILLTFLFYQILFRIKDLLKNRRRILFARLAYFGFIIISLFLFATYFTSKAKSLVEAKSITRTQFEINSERQIFLIGIDGANFDVMLPLVSRGLLPNIKKLMDQGTYTNLKTSRTAISPRIWASIDSGKIPAKHGILDFYSYSLPGISTPLTPIRGIGIMGITEVLSRAIPPFKMIETNNSNRQAKPIWEIISEQGTNIGAVNWLNSWPTHKVNGFILSDKFPFHLLQLPNKEDKIGIRPLLRDLEPSLAVAYPMKEIILYLQDYHKDKMLPGGSKIIEKPNNEGMIYINNHSIPFFSHLIEEYHPAFLALYIREPDPIQHHYWRYWQPQYFPAVKEEELKKNKDKIPKIYEEADKAIGGVMNIANKDAIIILASDHGFEAYFNSPNPGGHSHGPDGILIIAGADIKNNADIKNPTILDITPTTLYLFNLPIARDMDGRILTELITTEYRNKHPISYIDSYGKPAGEYLKIRDKISKEKIKQLKALGYIQ